MVFTLIDLSIFRNADIIFIKGVILLIIKTIPLYSNNLSLSRAINLWNSVNNQGIFYILRRKREAI